MQEGGIIIFSFWMILIECGLCLTLKTTDTTAFLRIVSFEFYNYKMIHLSSIWFWIFYNWNQYHYTLQNWVHFPG